MRQSDKEMLDGLERWLTSMHQPHLDECPSHDLAFDEDDFVSGDEQREMPINVNKALEDAGHNPRDFS